MKSSITKKKLIAFDMRRLECCPLCTSNVIFVQAGRVHGHGDYTPEIRCSDFEKCGLRFSPYNYESDEKLMNFWNELIKKLNYG